MSINWTAISAIGQMACAAATAWAVITTLRITRNAQKKQLEIKFQDDLGEIDDKIIFSGIRVTNIGQCIVELHDWGFMTDTNTVYHFGTGNDHQVKRIQKITLPQVLSPNTAIRLYFERAEIAKAVMECHVAGDFTELDKPLKLFVEDASGQKYLTDADKTVREYLEKAKQKE